MNNDPRDPRIIETASATTSSDNGNSGPFAYIITAVALGLIILLSLAGAGCMSLVLSTVAESELSGSTSGGYSTYNDLPYDYENMDFDDWLQYYDNELNNLEDLTNNQQDQGSASVDDVLDYSIAPYAENIDGELSASAYAGAPADVRDYVRAFVSADRDKSNDLVSILNDAALNEETCEEKIREAIALCDETAAFFESYELPSLEKDTNGEVRDLLGSAKGKAAERWKALSAELTLLDTTEEVDTSKLWELDGNVATSTEEAADELAAAMEKAATL